MDYQEPAVRRDGTVAGELGQILDTKERLREVIAQHNDVITKQTPFREYAQLIREIVTAPTLAGLKKALNNGNAAEKYPIGTEIEDTWDGNSNPLIVAHYTNITLANGGTKPGAYLVRKHVEPVAMGNGNGGYYPTSSMNSYLQGEYFAKCSQDVQNYISEVKVKWVSHVTTTPSTIQFNAKLFLMSCVEVYGTPQGTEGEAWDYWKQKVGTSNPINTQTAGRIVRSRDNSAKTIWLRSCYNSITLWAILANGALSTADASGTQYGVLPACAVVAD